LSFCTFSFGHCVFCSSSIYGFWLPLWYLQNVSCCRLIMLWPALTFALHPIEICVFCRFLMKLSVWFGIAGIVSEVKKNLREENDYFFYFYIYISVFTIFSIKFHRTIIGWVVPTDLLYLLLSHIYLGMKGNKLLIFYSNKDYYQESYILIIAYGSVVTLAEWLYESFERQSRLWKSQQWFDTRTSQKIYIYIMLQA
jgi:hypothetical protein